MKNIISSTGSFSALGISRINGNDDSFIWNSEKVNNILNRVEGEGMDIRGMKSTPFKDNDILLKRARLPFEYTPEEWEELEKCKRNPMYFAEKFAFIKTPTGNKSVENAGGLRDYQEQIIDSIHNEKYNILLASRQIGKTVTTGIYIVWFMLFHSEKNVLMVADNMNTTKEIMEKIRIVLDNLPFYMKPGIQKINESSIRFDNDSRLILRTTTKKSGIGMTVNFLYIDEFAHITESNLDRFYRAILPTITEDPNAKIVITSTPNGRNKFWEIWKDAIDRVNEYNPMRVDWWQVPGRDEMWKKKTIANMGSETDFNQEYGLQFFSSDRLLLASNDLKKLDIMKTEYIPASLDLREDLFFINDYLYFHEKYSKLTMDDFRNDDSKFVFSVDTADGVGADYSVINIFKLVPLPVKNLLLKKNTVRKELDCLSLVQIGTFRSNNLNIGDFSIALETLAYSVFNPENIRIVLELNHKGDLIANRLETNEEYWWGQMVHTKHTEMAKNLKVGVRLGPTNKLRYCEKFKYLVSINKIIPNEYDTFLELSCFGKSRGGTYRSQNGNDDLAITSINLSPFFDSPQFSEIGNEVYENTSTEYKNELYDKILNINMNLNKKSFDFNRLHELNDSLNLNTSKAKSDNKNVFDLDVLNQMRKDRDNFFKK
jgi:hypothetical protein